MKGYHDIRGDGGSDIVGQVVARRERIARRLGGVRARLAVGSGKGGVGKSTLTRQIASALAAAGRRVAILDLDLNGPSQARLAGLEPRPPVPGPDGLVPPRGPDGIGVVSLGTAVPEGRAVDFDEDAPRGDSHVWRATREFTAVAELLESVAWGELDVLLLDLPPGAERTFQYAEFLGPDVAFVLVTVPSAVSRGVVARSLDALRAVPNPVVGYVENMSGYWCEGCGEVRPLFPDGGIDLGVPCLGRVPFDPALAAASDAGTPVSGPDRPAARAVRAIAERLVAFLESR